MSMSGEYDTLIVKRADVAENAEGRRAVLIETFDGRRIAFELPDEVLHKFAASLAKLSAAHRPSNKPDA